MKISHLLFATGFAAITLNGYAGSVTSAPTTAAQTTNVAAPAASTPTTLSTTTGFSAEQVQQIQKIVHDYLINNPQVLVEASQALQKQTEQQEQAYAQTAIKQNAAQLFNDPASPVEGDANAAVTIVEFFDYQCGHCKEMNQIMQNLLKSNKDVRVVFKELPIFGDDSQFAAKAALASVKQGKYFAFHNALLAADNPINKDKVFSVAKSVGLNVDQLKTDMNNPAIQDQLRNNFKLAQALHLVGTPTFVIGNKALTNFRFIPGATTADNLQTLIGQVK